MTLQFKAALRDKGQANDDTKKLLLEVPVSALKGKVEELTGLVNRKVDIKLIPRYVFYKALFEKSTGKPIETYEPDEKGIWVRHEEQQMNLIGSNDVEEREFEIEFDVIDAFMSATTLNYKKIPKLQAIVNQLLNHESLDDVALSNKMSSFELETELNAARIHYAPYAAAWDKQRQEEKLDD